jgi:hypothetical protein
LAAAIFPPLLAFFISNHLLFASVPANTVLSPSPPVPTSPDLSICVLAIRDADDEYQQIDVGNRVDNSMPPDAHTIPSAFAGKLLATDRPRLIRQRQNPRHDALPISLMVDGLDLFGRGRLDQNPIFFHAA